MNLDEIRAELPVLERKAYLNTGTFGPLPRRTAEALERWQRRALDEGRAGHEFFTETGELRTRVRGSVGELIGAAADAVALVSSTTEGCDIVLAGLRLGPDDEVVTTDVEHPGLLGALRCSEARVCTARVRDLPAAGALDAIRAEMSERTRLIALSHVAWTTGAVLPVAELAAGDVPVLVDGAQSAGAIAVDVGALGCAFYTVSGQKWLLGPDTTGALYVAPEWIDRLRLSAPSYLSWEDPVALEPWPDARRFESSWIAPGSLAGLDASLAFARGAGEGRFERAAAVVGRLRELLDEAGVEVVTEPGQATLVSFRPPSGDATDLVARLAAADVVVRELPGLGWIRVSCGFWTLEDELERLVRAL